MDKVQNLDIPKILKFNIFKPIILIRRQYVLWNNSNAVGMGGKTLRVTASRGISRTTRIIFSVLGKQKLTVIISIKKEKKRKTTILNP